MRALADRRLGLAAPPSRFRDLGTRALSAALLLPTALACIWLGAEAWTALVAAAAALLAWEWVRLCGAAAHRPPGTFVPLAVLGAGLLAVEGAFAPAVATLAIGATALAVAGLRRFGRRRAAWLGFGVLYVGAAPVALIALRGDTDAGRDNVLFLFAVIWASDIGAYLAGRILGGPRLAPAISPNKTWAGALGGLAAAVASGAATAYVMPGPLPQPAPVVAVAAALGLLAQAGDLFESWIKRRFDVKDTSSLIPGHGGLLDRLDGVLAAAPAAALLGLAQGPGRALWA